MFILRSFLVSLIYFFILTGVSWCDDFKTAKDAFNEGDFNTAFSLFKPIAEGGNAEAMTYLGKMYAGERNEKIAAVWFRQAAELGEREAQFKLCIYRLKGWGVEKDEKQAFQWCSKAASQGLAPAQFNLGYMYKNGIGVKKDGSLAVKWYMDAAMEGDTKAQYNIGLMYLEGADIKQSGDEAIF